MSGPRDRHAAGRRERTGGRVEELRTGRFTSGDEYLAVLQQCRGLPQMLRTRAAGRRERAGLRIIKLRDHLIAAGYQDLAVVRQLRICEQRSAARALRELHAAGRGERLTRRLIQFRGCRPTAGDEHAPVEQQRRRMPVAGNGHPPCLHERRRRPGHSDANREGRGGRTLIQCVLDRQRDGEDTCR